MSAMKSLELVFLVLALWCSVLVASAGHLKPTRKQADEQFLTRQKDILGLLFGVGHKETFKSEHEDFDIAANAEHYSNVAAVAEFLSEFERGFLPDDEEFLLTNRKTLRQTIMLFDLFYYAKDFDTFYKTACWARKHVKDVQFAYVLYVAVYHRQDCRGMLLPAWYDVFPSSFISQEVMHKIYAAKMEGVQNLEVFVNNTGWEDYWQKKSSGPVGNGGFDAPFTHVEERISYFREDVGLNDFLAQMSLFYPTWLDPKKYQEGIYFKRGELFYYTMQQISARYSLERIYNGMPKTDMLYWDQPIKVGYNPKVTSPGGEVLYPRAFNMVPRVFNPAGVWKAEIIERRMIDDLDFGIIFWASNSSYGKLNSKVSINTWGNTICGTPEAAEHRLYGEYFRTALDAVAHIAKTGSEDEFVTGALGHQLTMARDPAFFMFLNRLMNILQRLKDDLPPYRKNELSFPGVKVDAIDVEPITTFFDRFDFEATNGVPLGSDQEYKDYQYVGRQTRLNHKPFGFKLKVTAERPVDAVIRLFIGPKFDAEERPLNLEEARSAIVEFDRFQVKLKIGENVFERDSKDSTGFIEDKEGLTSMYSRVENSILTKEAFNVSKSFICGLPQRLMIPKGSVMGTPLVFHAVVSPLEVVAPRASWRNFDAHIFCGGPKAYDGRPYGFPFDRRIDFEDFFQTPNIRSEEVMVYHGDEADFNRPETN